MNIFNLPDLGEGLAEAEIREWYVKEGDEVTVDQPLLSVETAKAVVDVPSPYSGKITKIHGKVHEVIQTHAPLVEFDGSAAKKDKGSIVGKLEENPNTLQEADVIIGSTHRSSIQVAPMVKAMAKQLKVDLNSVQGSGPKGQITIDDVKQYAKQKTSLNTGEALHGVRRSMAQMMQKAHQEVAQITIMDDADISHLSSDADLTVILLQAIASGVKGEPCMNAWFDGKALTRQRVNEVNIGLAMDTPEGLFVPVIKNVGQLSPQALREKINHFKTGVTARSIAASDMQEATITLTNFGTIAGRYATPIVVPPMVAILGSGKRYEKPNVKNGQINMARMLPLSLSADHRAVTGGEAARFLASVIQFLESK